MSTPVRLAVEAVVAHLRVLVPGDSGVLLLASEDSMQLGASWGLPGAEALMDQRFMADDYSCLSVPLKLGWPVAFACPCTPDPMSGTLASRHRTRLAVPLVGEKGLAGLLMLTRMGGSFANSEVALAQSLGSWAGRTLWLARRLDEEEAERRAMEQQLAMVVHELKAPLTVILGYTDLVRRSLMKETDVEREQYRLGSVAQQGERMSRLLDDLLAMSAIKNTKLRLDKKFLDLAEMVERVVETVRSTASRHSLKVVHPSEPATVLADHDRLEQVLFNLLNNAVKYSAKGDIVVEVAVRGRWSQELAGPAGLEVPGSILDCPRPVEPAGEFARVVEVRVADEGSGLVPDELSRVFDPFYRASGAPAGGSGLGLYVSKGIVEAHGGRMWAESPGPNQGSTFCFTLPAAQGVH